MRRIILSVFSGLLFFLVSNFADTGSSALPFLRYGVGARAVGMAGAFSGLSNDSTSIYWNPAGISGMGNKSLSFSHSILSDGRNENILFLVLPGKKNAFGLAIHMAGVKGLTEYNSGISGDEFSWDNSIYYVSYSKKVTDTLQYGINLKYFSSKIKDTSGRGFGFDFGIKTYFSEKVSIGFVLKDINSSLKWDTDTKDEVPFYAKTGITVKLFDYKLLVNGDIGRVKDESSYRYSIGAEYWPIKNFAFRAGISQNGFATGITVGFKKFNIDYAFADEDISSKQLLSLSLKF